MKENNESNKYLNNNDLKENKTFVDIPSNQNSSPAPLPVPFTPMGEISNRGRAASSYTKGSTSWWILITGWFIFGIPALVLIVVAIDAILNRVYLAALFPLAIAFILISLVWRGTSAKLKNRRRKLKQR